MRRLIVVSNRLPITIESLGDRYDIRPSSGGLVSALRPLLRRVGGCWIGSAEDANTGPLIESIASEQFQLSPVFLPAELRRDYYDGFCNEILWPLFHDLQSRCNFEPRYWHRYREANRHFSGAIACQAAANDIVWVHDYHLMLQGGFLSGQFDRKNLLYFHHVPFPPPDVFEKLPWRRDILESLLGFGLLGFQTSRDRQNFAACIRRLFPGAVLKKNGAGVKVLTDRGETVLGTFPIGIDFDDFNRTAMSAEVARAADSIRSRLESCRIILGVDRLDYTKGILERIKGFRVLLERYPGLRQRVALIQIAVPSREGVAQYCQLKNQLHEVVDSVNATFGRPGWVPIEYLHRHLSREELVAYYRAADIALITPVKDGMNLVCKEFCASRTDEPGVLVLSEFAGAAHELRTGALLVNPYDAEGVAAALYKAFEMDPRDAARRMRRMRKVVQAQDVFHWCNDILSSSGGPGATAKIMPRSETRIVSRQICRMEALGSRIATQVNGIDLCEWAEGEPRPEAGAREILGTTEEHG